MRGPMAVPAGEEQGAARWGAASLVGSAAGACGLLAVGGTAAALLDAEGADGSPAACSQRCHGFAVVPLGKSSLFPS